MSAANFSLDPYGLLKGGPLGGGQYAFPDGQDEKVWLLPNQDPHGE